MDGPRVIQLVFALSSYPSFAMLLCSSEPGTIPNRHLKVRRFQLNVLKLMLMAHTLSGISGTLPSLQIPSGELLGSSEVRPWLEKEYPLPEDQRA